MSEDDCVKPLSSLKKKKKKKDLKRYLEHVCVVVMAVLHHHCLVAGQSEGDAVLPPAVDGLQRQRGKLKRCTFWGKVLYFHNIVKTISAAVLQLHMREDVTPRLGDGVDLISY